MTEILPFVKCWSILLQLPGIGHNHSPRISMEAGGRTSSFLHDLNTWKALNGMSDI
jgi:hypothetical protein